MTKSTTTTKKTRKRNHLTSATTTISPSSSATNFTSPQHYFYHNSTAAANNYDGGSDDSDGDDDGAGSQQQHRQQQLDCRQDFHLIINKLKNVFCDQSKQRVLILVGQDVDAICTLFILTVSYIYNMCVVHTYVTLSYMMITRLCVCLSLSVHI